MDKTYKFIKQRGGVDTWASYPYTGKVGLRFLFVFKKMLIFLKIFPDKKTIDASFKHSSYSDG